MTPQFIHVETYGRASPKKARERRWTVREVVAELVREAGAHPHVRAPRAHELAFGREPVEVEQDIMAVAERAVDPKGRKLRRDAQILVAGVVSFPVRLDALGEKDRVSLAAWENDTIVWLRAWYGDRLKAVVRHVDESYPHLHFLAVPDLAAGERVEALHPGKAAIAAAKQEGVKEKRILDQRYRTAMRSWQDAYWREVGAKHQLSRHGPRRRRLSRSAWQVERQVAEVTLAAVAERDRLRCETERLWNEADRLRETLRKVIEQARRVVAALLDPAKADRLERPRWLPDALWLGFEARLRQVRSLVSLKHADNRRAPMVRETAGWAGRVSRSKEAETI